MNALCPKKLNIRYAKLVRIEINAKGKLVWSPDTSRTRMICRKAHKNTMMSPVKVVVVVVAIPKI